jgi:hypothetical protein
MRRRRGNEERRAIRPCYPTRGWSVRDRVPRVANRRADQDPSPRRAARHAPPRHVAGERRAVHLALDPRQDRRPGRARQRRAPRALRRALASAALADRRFRAAPRMSASAGARRAAHRLRPRGPCRSARAASGPLDLSEIGAARNAATAGRRPLQRRRSQARLADLLADRAPVDTKANLKVEILDLDTTGELRARPAPTRSPRQLGRPRDAQNPDDVRPDRGSRRRAARLPLDGAGHRSSWQIDDVYVDLWLDADAQTHRSRLVTRPARVTTREPSFGGRLGCEWRDNYHRRHLLESLDFAESASHGDLRAAGYARGAAPADRAEPPHRSPSVSRCGGGAVADISCTRRVLR